MEQQKDYSKIQYDHIDLLKFLACFFVLMYHSTTVNYNIINTPNTLTFFHYLLRPLLSICVPLFFFANGFLLINKPLNLRKHCHKMLRLILLTIIWGIITLLALMPLKNQWLSTEEFFHALRTWRTDWINHLWFMGALICIYIFFPLIKSAFDHNKKTLNYWLAICVLLTFGNSLACMISTLLHYYLSGNTEYISLNYFSIFNPLSGTRVHAFAYFAIGCFFGSNPTWLQSKLYKSKKFLPLFILIISTIMLGLWGILSSKITGKVWDVVWMGYDTIFTAVNVLSIYQLSTSYKNKNKKINNFIKVISRNTLGIYFTHIIVIHLLEKTGLRFLPFANNYLFNIVYTLIILVSSLLIVLLLKHIPLIKKLVV